MTPELTARLKDVAHAHGVRVDAPRAPTGERWAKRPGAAFQTEMEPEAHLADADPLRDGRH